MDKRSKTLLGGLLLAAGTAVILYVSGAGEPIIPGVLGSIAMLAMAVGALLLGTAEYEGRPV